MATTETALSGAVSAAGARTHRARAYLALLLGMLGISTTAILTKWAAVPGPVAATYRMAFAALILALPFFLRRRRAQVRPSGATVQATVQSTVKAAAPARGPLGLPWLAVRIAALGGLWFGLNLAMLNSALLLTSAATATLLDNTAPIWVGIGALLFFHERLPRAYWLGLAMALTGAAVVSGLQVVMSGGHLAFNRGDVIALVGAVFYAAYLLTTQRARRDLDAVSYLWLIDVSAAVALVCITLALGFPLAGYSAGSLNALFAVALIAQTGGWLMIAYAMGYLPASTAVVVLLGQPIVTSLLSIPLLGEALTVYQVCGGALILLGIYICVRQQNR